MVKELKKIISIGIGFSCLLGCASKDLAIRGWIVTDDIYVFDEFGSLDKTQYYSLMYATTAKSLDIFRIDDVFLPGFNYNRAFSQIPEKRNSENYFSIWLLEKEKIVRDTVYNYGARRKEYSLGRYDLEQLDDTPTRIHTIVYLGAKNSMRKKTKNIGLKKFSRKLIPKFYRTPYSMRRVF